MSIAFQGIDPKILLGRRKIVASKLRDELRRQFREALKAAKIRGGNNALTQISEHVAFKKNNQLRVDFANVMTNWILSPLPNMKIEFDKTKDVLPQLRAKSSYTKYHVDGAPRTGTPYYREPTTADTYPFKSIPMNTIVNNEINKAVLEELRSRGLLR